MDKESGVDKYCFGCSAGRNSNKTDPEVKTQDVMLLLSFSNKWLGVVVHVYRKISKVYTASTHGVYRV